MVSPAARAGDTGVRRSHPGRLLRQPAGAGRPGGCAAVSGYAVAGEGGASAQPRERAVAGAVLQAVDPAGGRLF